MPALHGIDLADSALLTVDVQRDFRPGGSMGIDGADGIIGPLNEAIIHFRSIGRPVRLAPAGDDPLQGAGWTLGRTLCS